MERLLILLALYKVRALTSEGMRLRTACDLHVKHEEITTTMPPGWLLPVLDDLKEDMKAAIAECRNEMVVNEVTFEDELKKGKARNGTEPDDAGDAEDDNE